MYYYYMYQIWNMKSKLCIGSCQIVAENGANPGNSSEGIPYCVSCVFAPGGRFVLVGTKEGYIKVIFCFVIYLYMYVCMYVCSIQCVCMYV